MTYELNTGRGGVWTDSELYMFLVNNLPGHLSSRGTLDVKKLKSDVGRSHERVYQWLRDSRLTPDNAKALCSLANTPENLAKLAEIDRQPPSIQDFYRFVFAD